MVDLNRITTGSESLLPYVTDEWGFCPVLRQDSTTSRHRRTRCHLTPSSNRGRDTHRVTHLRSSKESTRVSNTPDVLRVITPDVHRDHNYYQRPRRIIEKRCRSSERTETLLELTPYHTVSTLQRKGRDASVGPKNSRCPKDDEETRRDYKRKSIKPFLHQQLRNKPQINNLPSENP